MNVCAIILDYFGADKTEKCLMSLASQGIKTIYLLDNSGSHSISEKLTSTVARVLATGVDFKVEIFSVGANLGFSKGVNFVLVHDRRSASSPYMKNASSKRPLSPTISCLKNKQQPLR